LVFSGCRYQNFVDTCEVLSFELSYWAFRNAKKLSQRNPRRNKTDLKLRGHPKDLFNLSNRNACLGICTVLLVFNRPKGDYFYVQKRSASVLESPFGFHLVPSGTFQPDMAEDANHARDFSLLRSVLRELAEELLGFEELQKAIWTHGDFLEDARLAPFRMALENKSMQAFYLGVGFNPSSTKLDLLTVLTINWAEFTDKSLEFIENWEGSVLPVSLAQIKEWSVDPRLHGTGQACLRIVSKHLPMLLRA
jgi:hypothetical protein